jgi:hypothetical protein
MATLDAAITTIGDIPIEELSAPAQLDLLRVLHPLLTRLDAQVTRTVGVVHRQGSAGHDGAVSTQAWLRSRLRTGDGRTRVRAAHALTMLPELAAAYQRGEVSLAHVSVAAQVVDDIHPDVLAAGAGKLLAEQATEAPPAVFRRAATRIRDHFDPDAADRRARKRLTEHHLSVAKTFDGAVAINGLFDPDAGELLLRTLDAHMPPPRLDDPRLPSARRADALLQICRTAADHAPHTGGSKPTVTITIDWPTLQDQTVELFNPAGRWTGATLPDHTHLTAQAARRLACDSQIIPVVLGGRSEPLDIGRATRVIPPAIRRALILRDGGCRYPGCDRPPEWTDAHHLTHWANGGPTALHNLILLCRHHHTRVHEGRSRIHLDPDTGIVTAYHPDGTPHDLTSHPNTNGP